MQNKTFRQEQVKDSGKILVSITQRRRMQNICFFFSKNKYIKQQKLRLFSLKIPASNLDKMTYHLVVTYCHDTSHKQVYVHDCWAIQGVIKYIIYLVYLIIICSRSKWYNVGLIKTLSSFFKISFIYIVTEFTQ